MSKSLKIDLARARLVGHLIEQGLRREFAEAHAASVTYETFDGNDGVLIHSGTLRAFSEQPKTLTDMAAAIAKEAPQSERGDPSGSSEQSGDSYDPVAAGKAAAEASRRSKELSELARR